MNAFVAPGFFTAPLASADLELAAANQPGIRFITYPNVGAQTPVWTHAGANWVVSTPQSARSFSAEC